VFFSPWFGGGGEARLESSIQQHQKQRTVHKPQISAVAASRHPCPTCSAPTASRWPLPCRLRSGGDRTDSVATGGMRWTVEPDPVVDVFSGKGTVTPPALLSFSLSDGGASSPTTWADRFHPVVLATLPREAGCRSSSSAPAGHFLRFAAYGDGKRRVLPPTERKLAPAAFLLQVPTCLCLHYASY
jgi:hypothetical protein